MTAQEQTCHDKIRHEETRQDCHNTPRACILLDMTHGTQQLAVLLLAYELRASCGLPFLISISSESHFPWHVRYKKASKTFFG